MSTSRRTSNRTTKFPSKFGDSVVNMAGKSGVGNENSKGNQENSLGSELSGKVVCEGNEQSGGECCSQGTQTMENLCNVSNQVPLLNQPVCSPLPVNKHVNTDVNCVNNTTKDKPVSFVDAVSKNGESLQQKLVFRPTVVNDKGKEVVDFDDELVKIGSAKWQLTVVGYFVGVKMSAPELRYHHLRRMWGRFGLKDVIVNSKGHCFFKFGHEEGLSRVIEQGPWMVNNKPLMVQRWDPDVEIETVEHAKLPVWVKLYNVPLEAWCSEGISAIASSMVQRWDPDVEIETFEHAKLPVWVKLYNVPLEAWCSEGISAIASSIGKPLVMDSVTASMCSSGLGRFENARVLVEIDAKKEFKEEIELQYRGKDGIIRGHKKVKVEYSWKPPVCTLCSAFVLCCEEVAALEYPFLDIVEDEDGLDKKNPLPYAKIVPIISEDYQYIVVHAPPYHSIGFKVTNVQIVYMEAKWNGLRGEYSVHAYFKGPNDAARFKLKYETPFPSLYQQPPP